MTHRPELKILQENWKTMREEAAAITEFFPDVTRPKGPLDAHPPELIIRMLECEGWSKIEDTDGKWWNFPLIAFKYSTDAARKKAPKTVELLEKVGGSLFCGFSMLLPNGIIAPHTDPVLCEEGPIAARTYHLGLDCPEHCYLIHGQRVYEEKDGKLIVFDKTQKHSAVNMSDRPRVILYATFYE